MRRVETTKDQSQEQLLVWIACQFGTSVVSKMLKEGYVLTTDVLEVLYILGYSPAQIIECLQSCIYYKNAEALYNWLCVYLGKSATEEILIAALNPDTNLLQYFSVETLEKYKLWNILKTKSLDSDSDVNREDVVQQLEYQQRILIWVAVKYRCSGVLKCLQEGYTLTTNVLDTLHFLGSSPQAIMECIQSCKHYEDAKCLYDWLCRYLGKEPAEDFILAKLKNDVNFLQFISNGTLEKKQYWDELSRRKADDILYQHRLYEKLSPEGLYERQLYAQYFKDNWRIDPNDNAALNYLALTINWEVIARNFEENCTNENLLNFLIKHKKFDIIAKKNKDVLLSFPEGMDYLRKRK